MKLTIIFWVAALLQVTAASYGQKITLNVKNVSFEQFLDNLKQQSKYHFLYDDQLLSKANPVTLKVNNQPLEKVLAQCFSNQPFTYVIKNDNVIITRIPPNAIAQVSGVVTNDKNQPLSGVNVRIKGTQTGVVTDKDGRYTLPDVKPDAVLQFSFIGFETKEIQANGQIIINVVLVLSQDKLNEVVVIGYGNTKRRDLTGAVATAPIADMQKAPVANIADALAGRVAGVVVSSPDGQPGSIPNIVIRGNNSVSQSNSPLYVIDGFPIENASLTSINPDDIESIEILKDASATAIYGARGSNGVILITTKQGKQGPAVINFGAYYGFQKILKKMDLLDPYQYVQYQIEKDKLTNNLYTNPVTGVKGPGTVSDSSYLKYATLDDYRNIKGTDFQDQIFRTAAFKNYDLSVSGGNNQTRYFISGNILNQDGIIINSGFKRYQGRVVLDQTVNSKVKVGINANYSNVTTWGGSPSSTDVTGGYSTRAPFYGIWGTSPVAAINSSGQQSTDLESVLYDPSLHSNGTDPLLINPVTNQQHMLRSGSTNILAANAYLEYKIAPSLTLRVTGGITTNALRTISFNDTLTSMGNPKMSTNGANGSVINSTNNSWLNENMLTYNKVFKGGHTLIVNAIVSEQAGNTAANGASAIKLPNPSLGVSGLDEGTPGTIIASSSNWTLASFTGRVNYDFNKKYFFTITYRADGSSRFSPQNKWAYFPSGAFKWRFSDEDFLKGNSILSDGSLRLSYGQTGNNRVNDFAYLSAVAYSLSGAVFGNTIQPSSAPISLANPDLKWETTTQTNLGTDLSFFNSRVNITADVYRKTTDNLLLNAVLPPVLGYASAYKNIGSIQNQGLELSINGTLYRNTDFSWTSSFNIAWNQSKVLSLTQNQDALLVATYFDLNYRTTPAYITKVGQPLGQMYGLVFDGLYQVSDFNYTTAINPSAGSPGTGSHYILKDNVPTNGNARAAIQPGDVKYKDLNGDGIINALDETVIGRGLPIATGGFGNNFTYKNFDVNIFFQWSLGNDIQNANRIMFDGNGNGQGAPINFFATAANRWTPTNTNTNEFRIGGQGPIGYYSSRTVEDGSYIRLKTIQIGYNLPKRLLMKAGLKTCRIYASGQNILTWTKYSGIDPEISTFNSVLTPGLDYSGYPRSRTITFGTNISF